MYSALFKVSESGSVEKMEEERIQPISQHRGCKRKVFVRHEWEKVGTGCVVEGGMKGGRNNAREHCGVVGVGMLVRE